MSLLFVLVQVILLVSVFVLNSAQRHEHHALKGSCPSVCQCKWKNGKEVVECIDRALITIPDTIDPGSQVLDISNNNLQILPKEAFKRVGLVHMQRIYLRNCKIGQIDDHAFYKLTNLVELDLSFNLLTSVPNGIFPDVHSLREILLAHNPIQKIDAHTFLTARALLRLDLSNCAIELIAPKAFDGIEQLELLKINGNKLTELRPRTIDVFTRLHNFELHDNLWNCDCRVRIAKEFIVKHNIKPAVEPVCSSGPERVLHKRFVDLHVDDFACKPEILPVSRYIEASAGENASLICRASAIPPPEIKWFYQGRLLGNNSNFSPFQKVFIYTNGTNEKKSKLLLTNSQELDSSEFYCVAENRAGSTEANFTLHVALRPAGFSSLNSGQIVGLSAALVVLILLILLIIVVLLVRLRRIPFIETKTPGQVEVMVVNGAVGCPKTTIVTTSDSNVETSSFIEPKATSNGKTDTANPVQKPPRLNDLPYTTSHYNGNGSIVNAVPCYVSPSSTSGNNPDLINDTKRLGSGDIPTSAADSIVVAVESMIKCDDTSSLAETTTTTIERPSSGEYIRNGSDSLYPSGNWAGSSSSDLYIKRVGSSTITYDDKTPIMGDSEAESLEYCSKSLPRMHPPTMGTMGTMGGHVNPGYPPDYGLPIVEPRTIRKPPAKAKVQRIYQQGGVPVLPPVNALKRSRCRGSPDEGYQEGPQTPTDV